MYRNVLFGSVMCLCLAGCGTETENKTGGNAEPVAGGKKIDLQMGTPILEDHAARYDLQGDIPLIKKFYENRNQEFVWVSESGPNSKSRDLITLLQTEIIARSLDTLKQKRLFILYNYLSHPDYEMENAKDATEFELLATVAFFEYAKRNWEGVSEEDSKYTGWRIKRKKIDYEQELMRFLKSDLAAFEKNAPVYYQYLRLNEQLKKYIKLAKEGGWEDWTGEVKQLKPGDTDTVIKKVKRQLWLLGDLETEDTTHVFDSTMTEAVKHFQMRHGLLQTGIISGRTLDAMAVPVNDRIQQIMVNMERFRWFPASVAGDHLIVNIPAFRLWVCQDNTVDWVCNVIVGKPITKTVIFNDTLENIVFSPYWNIPQSIIIHEIIPDIRRRPGYLASHNMEVVTNSGRPVSAGSIDWSNTGGRFPYIIRQRPGNQNSLGWVKFQFPNRYDIYLHDTPARSLFAKEQRAFSHGCVRVEEPQKLAEFILRDEESWPPSRIKRVMYAGKETYVRVKNKMPVFIAYFTAWVDNQGNLDLRNDIYGYDEKVKDVLFF